MDRKSCFILLLCFVLFGGFSAACAMKPRREYVRAQRELLKDYFLCVCIGEDFRDLRISEQDVSQAVYFDTGRYAPEAFREVAGYAKKFVESIGPTDVEDLGRKKAVILNCIDKYKSREIDRFIESMDRYMLGD